MPEKSASTFPFPGFGRPNYTQVPDELFDVLMPSLSECELRVLLYIVRRTFGFKRDSDFISLSQLVDGIVTRDGERLDHGAGVARSSAVRAIKGLLEKGVIVATKRSSVQRGNETTSYALRFASSQTPTVVVAQFHGETRGAGSTMKPPLVAPRNPQETVEQQTAFESSKGEKNVEKSGVGEDIQPEPTGSNKGQTRAFDEGSLSAILKHRVRRDVGREDRAAIGVAIERFADELGDQADAKVSISRALIVQAPCLSGWVVDALTRARGEVIDRRAYPAGPVPRNRMAYFIAVVEDRWGQEREVTNSYNVTRRIGSALMEPHFTRAMRINIQPNFGGAR